MKTTMKYSWYVLAGSALLFAACNKEVAPDDNQNVTPSARVETLSVQTESDTKVDVNGSGVFSWTAGDQIAVWKGTDASTGAYTICDVVDGKVEVSLGEGESRYNYAVYPAASKVDASYSFSDLQVTLPASYKITDKPANYSPLPMIALQTAENTISFKTLTGLLRLNVIGVPNTTTTLTVNIGDNKIVGTYNVANVPTSEHPNYTPTITKNDSGSTEIVYTIHASGSVGANPTLNIPLPLGSYTGGTITIVAKDASDRLLDTATKTYSAFTVTRNKGITSSVKFATVAGLKFSTGNLYTTVDGSGNAVLHVAADPFAHMTNYPTDMFSSANYSLANRAIFSWNEAKILLDGGTPTYATSQITQKSMGGKVIDGYYWTVPKIDELRWLSYSDRIGSTVNDRFQVRFLSVVVNLSGSTYENKGLCDSDGTATQENSNYMFGALIFPDNATITTTASFTDAQINSVYNYTSITYTQLQELKAKGCFFYPGNGFYYSNSGYARAGVGVYSWSSTEATNNASHIIFRETQPFETVHTKHDYYFDVWLVRRYKVTTE